MKFLISVVGSNGEITMGSQIINFLYDNNVKHIDVICTNDFKTKYKNKINRAYLLNLPKNWTNHNWQVGTSDDAVTLTPENLSNFIGE